MTLQRSSESSDVSDGSSDVVSRPDMKTMPRERGAGGTPARQPAGRRRSGIGADGPVARRRGAWIAAPLLNPGDAVRTPGGADPAVPPSARSVVPFLRPRTRRDPTYGPRSRPRVLFFAAGVGADRTCGISFCTSELPDLVNAIALRTRELLFPVNERGDRASEPDFRVHEVGDLTHVALFLVHVGFLFVHVAFLFVNGTIFS